MSTTPNLERSGGITLTDLKSHLWNCAEILRGSAVDRTDWKGYILPLLFFKRLSDVWDEEQERMLAEYGEEFADEHRFQIPEGCHWQDVRETPQAVGTALSHALREIERANPDTLFRVFGAVDWGNREILSDENLKDLIEHRESELSEMLIFAISIIWSPRTETRYFEL